MDITKIKQRDVVFLAKNDSFIVDDTTLLCRKRPSDEAVSELRANIQYYTELMAFLSIGTVTDAAWFKKLKSLDIPADGVATIDDAISYSELSIDYNEKEVTILYPSGDIELQTRKAAKGRVEFFFLADMSLSPSKRSDEPAMCLLIDWDDRTTYLGETDMGGGIFNTSIRPVINKCGSLKHCFAWSNYRLLFEKNLPRDFNPTTGL